jgi:excisionase family DNA binding protein
MNRSGRGRGARERVDAARRQAALAIGRDPDQRDSFIEPPRQSSPMPASSAAVNEPRRSESVAVLSLGEAAARLGVARAHLEAMIDRGAVEALPTGFTRMIPTTEVERLLDDRSQR